MPAIDDFGGRREAGVGSAIRAHLVTPSDGVDLPYVSLWIRATSAGNIQVTMKGAAAANEVVVLPFLAGETQRIRVSRVWLANTTAAGIVAYS